VRSTSKSQQKAALDAVRELNASLKGLSVPTEAALDQELRREIEALRSKLDSTHDTLEQVRERGPIRVLRTLTAHVRQTIEPIRNELVDYLADLEGHSFRSFEEKLTFADGLRNLLDQLGGLRVKCTTCGSPAILKARLAGSKSGKFQFSHTVPGGTTNHGGTVTVPTLELIKPQPDPRRKGRKPVSP